LTELKGTEMDLGWADCWLVRSRSANLRFMSHLRIFGSRFYRMSFKLLLPRVGSRVERI